MKKTNLLLIAGFILLALTSVAVLVYTVRFSNKPKVKSIAPLVLFEGKDSIVEVRGKNLPELNRLHADFGGIPARIISRSDNGLSVVVDIPKLLKMETGEEFSEDFVVRFDSASVLHSQKVLVKPDTEIRINEINPKSFQLSSTITLLGNNLHKTGQIEVYFGKNAPYNYDLSQMQKAAIIPVSRKLLKVRVPEIPGVEWNANNVNIKVVSGGNSIYTTLGTLKKTNWGVYDSVIVVRPRLEAADTPTEHIIRDHRTPGRIVDPRRPARVVDHRRQQ
ncbi:MAG TPA: IPT/TIG domain-containing protein [Chryseolinea sp.]